MKKKFAALVLACMVVLAATTAFAASISIATGGTTGTYFPIGGAIATAVSKHPDLNATAESGNASAANANLLTQGEIEIAIVQADVTAWAFNGEVLFEGNALTNLRTIAALYPETLQVIVAKESSIATFGDMIGKRVGVGAAGSGVELVVRTIFNTLGISYDDMNVQFLDFAQTSDRFKDNQIDAGFIVAGLPTPAVMDLTTTRDVDLVSFDDAAMAQLVAANPFFVPNVVPAGTYRGIDHDVQTPSVMALLVTHEDVPEEVIYNFTKTMFENIADVQQSHGMARHITLESATSGLTAPLHPGAAKFYTEVGIAID